MVGELGGSLSSPDLRTPDARGSSTCGDRAELAPGAPAQLASRRSLLAFGGPRDVLARIVDGDPLGLRALLAERLAKSHLLVDADRVHLRALALTARHAPAYRGRPGLEEWLGALVDRALDEVIAEEVELLELVPSSREPELGTFAELARPLALLPREARRACARFNRAPRESRAAFFELVLERAPLDELARRTTLAAPELARRARRALLALLDLGSSAATEGIRGGGIPSGAIPVRDVPDGDIPSRGIQGSGPLRGSGPDEGKRTVGMAVSTREALP